MIRYMGSHKIINASIITLALFVFGLTGGTAWDAYNKYQAARQVARANTMADSIIVAAGIEAVERGMTSAALGAKTHADAVTLQKISELRRSGDAAWDSALAAARGIAKKEFPPESSFAATMEQAVRAHRVLEKARLRVDNCLQKNGCDIGGKEWIDAITNFIASAARVWEVVFVSLETPHRIVQLNLSIKRWVWLASEHAGRERGTLAYYISSHQPLPPLLLDELKAYRGVAERNIIDIRSLKEMPDTDPRILQAIGVMEKSFLNNFETTRRQAYAGVEKGNYPISGAYWVEKSTQAINSILTVAAAVTQVSDEQAENAIREKANYLVLVLVLVGVTSVLVVLSLTKVRQTTNELLRQKELAEVTLHSIGDAVITTDAEARIEYLNPVAEQITGWSSKDAAGRPLREIFTIVNGLTREPEANPIEKCLEEGKIIGLTSNTVLVPRDGREIVIEDSAAPIRNGNGGVVGAVMVFYDVTLMRHAPHLLSYHATHDALTGLINRREFERRLGELLTTAKSLGQEHAFCYLDLDQFKIINDTCGHAVGDRLLRQLTFLLQERVRDADTLARLGGDEFGVLLAGCPLERALRIAESLRQVVKDFRFMWENRAFELSVSIGLVPITAASVSPAEIMSEADAACYAAKEKGRNRVQVYQPGNVELARRQGEMQWVSRITEALKEDRFVLYCQEIVPTGKANGKHWEILVRLLDEEGNLVPPMTFIPAAERYNLMPAVDRWVISTALKSIGQYLRSHPRSDNNTLWSINLSGASISEEGLQGYIHEQLTLHRVPPHAVGFEVTETAAIANLDHAATLIKALKQEGCHFALDDFGRGLSSFAYLKTLPVDYLKIDGSFVKGMLDDPVAYAMVQAINTVGHVMNIKTIAEYVENDTLLEKLREIGVDYAQGFGIGHPRPFAECMG